MKTVAITSLKLLLAGLALACAATSANAQGARLHIENLSRLEDKADKTIDVTVDGALLDMASKALASDKSPDAQKAREAISGLKGIYVKSFEFEREGAYSPADVEQIRSQLNGPGWSRMVGVRSKRAGQNVEVYMLTEAGKVAGLAIIATDPKRFTVVNVVGMVDVEKLGMLDGQFGIPGIRLERHDGPSGH